MIKLTKKKLLMIEFFIGVFAIIVALIALMAFAGERTFTLSKDTIDQILSSKLPITKPLEAQNPISKNRIEGQITVNTIGTELLDETMKVTINGRLLVGRKEIQYTTLAIGHLEYRPLEAYSFFFIPESDGVNLSFSQKPSKVLGQHLAGESTKSKLGGVFKKIFKSKLTSSVRKKLEAQFDGMIMGAIQLIVTNRLKKRAFYRLKEDLVSSTIKIGLQKISIKPSEVLITISFTKLATAAITILLIIALLIGFIVYTIRHPDDVIFGFIDLSLAVADGSLKVS